MYSMQLPRDLLHYLKTSTELKYDSTACEAGRVTLWPTDALRVELFPMDCQSTPAESKDPNYRSYGCYLVPAVGLTASAEHYDPDGLLLWLPGEHRYGCWDSSHNVIWMFSRTTTWTKIAKKPAEHINDNWLADTKLECLRPWLRYRHWPEQLGGPIGRVVPKFKAFLDSEFSGTFTVLQYGVILRKRGSIIEAKCFGFPNAIGTGTDKESADNSLRAAMVRLISGYFENYVLSPRSLAEMPADPRDLPFRRKLRLLSGRHFPWRIRHKALDWRNLWIALDPDPDDNPYKL